MKRASFILIAALLVLLVYPSTHPLAKSPNKAGDGVMVMSPFPGSITPIVLTDSDDDDSDDGDADGLTGNRDRGTRPGGSARVGTGAPSLTMIFKMWWKHVVWVR